MGNLQIKLLIDSDPSASSDLQKWKYVLQKYLVYGLEKKGFTIKVLNNFSLDERPVEKEETSFVFLPILSKGLSTEYMKRLKTFFSSPASSSSINIALQKEGNTNANVNLHPDLKIWEMFIIDHENGQEIPEADIWKKENFNLLLFKIVDLCNEIEAELNNVRLLKPALDSKAVYLAETTPDLNAVREEVKRELIRKGFVVYPKNHLSGNVKDLEKGIFDLLQKSILSIHLFGKLYKESKAGETLNIELENKIAAQFYLNKKESKKVNNTPFRRIIWFPDHLNVSDEKQIKLLEALQKDKKLYAGADIIKSSVEELKDIILEKLTEKLQKMAGVMIVQNKLASIKDCLRVE